MRQRMLISALGLLLLMTALPAAAQTPEASPVPVGALDTRSLDIEADPSSLALSPDGQWLAGVGPDGTPCFWDIETLTPKCAAEELPILTNPSYPAMAWAPDSSAVAFSLDAPRLASDSDIYVFEREGGTLTNLTDDGYDGGLLDAPAGVPIDIVPTWSPDGQQIVFSRSLRENDSSSTTVMRIDRTGGEPVAIVTPEIEEPMAVWMPMHWLPDDTILYSLVSMRPDEPLNGVWRVGVDGTGAEQLIPGDADSDIPAAMVADLSADGEMVSVFSPLLLGQFSVSWDQPIFWLGSLHDGARQPLPLYDAEEGVALDPASVEPSDANGHPLTFPVSPAAFSPDGSSALAIYRDVEDGFVLATVDLARGEVAILSAWPEEAALLPMQPQWADNGTVLVQAESGPVLLTMRD